MNTSTVIVHLPDGSTRDVEIPNDITAEQLIGALHQGFVLQGRKPGSLRTENPIAYMSGHQKIAEFGIHNGTEIFFAKE